MKELSKIIIKYIKDVKIIKKLPKIYQNDIDKKINNNKKMYYFKYEDNLRNNMNLNDINFFIDGLFNSYHQVYNIPIVINTNNKTYDTYLVSRRGDYILTIDNDKIFIRDIISINRKNP